jgi:adenine deaminase
MAFIKNFGLKEGAIASCVGHDSHNILAVGTNETMICRAVNLIIQNSGGLSALNASEEISLPLPVAGIMTNRDAFETAALMSRSMHLRKDADQRSLLHL